MCMLIELYLAIANSVSHSGHSLSDIDMSDRWDCWDFPCSEDKQEAQVQSATSTSICVCICLHIRVHVLTESTSERACVCVKGMVPARQ